MENIYNINLKRTILLGIDRAKGKLFGIVFLLLKLKFK